MSSQLRIGQLLKQRRMTQSALAQAIEVSPGFLSEIISGKKEPSMKTLRLIAEEMGCSSVSELYQPARDTLRAPQPNAHQGSMASQLDSRDELSKRLVELASIGVRSQNELEVFQMSIPCPGLQLMRGDLLVVGPFSKSQKPGSAVLIKARQAKSGADRILLGIWTGEGILPPPGDPGLEQSEETLSLSRLHCSFRPPKE